MASHQFTREGLKVCGLRPKKGNGPVSLLSPYVRLYRSLAPEGRRFLWVSATVEYQYLGIYLIAVNLYLLRLGFGPEFIGNVTGSGIAAYSTTAFLSGYLFHRRSATRLVTNGVLLIAVGLVGIAFTDIVPASARAPWIIVTNALAWMGGGFFGVGRLPYLTSVAPTGQRVLTFTLERLMGIGLAVLGGLGVTFVPGLAARLLGVTLDDPAPYRMAILLAPAGLLPALVLFRCAARRAPARGERPDDEVEGGRPPTARISPTTIILLLSVFAVLFNFAGTPPLYFFNVYLDDGLAISPALIAFVMGVARLGSLPATMLLPALTRRFSMPSLLVIISLGLALAMIPMALVPEPLVASLSFLTCSLLLALYEPVFDLYRMDVVPASAQTRMAGTTQTATYAAQSIAGFAGGYVVVAMGYPSLFLGAAILAFAAALLLGNAQRRERRSSQPFDRLPTPFRSEA
ncbi:MAG TPA: MFS transporter [Kofleriaceae bacterium]|nr:MFS transporter [Kofleriaceae bacterium]